MHVLVFSFSSTMTVVKEVVLPGPPRRKSCEDVSTFDALSSSIIFCPTISSPTLVNNLTHIRCPDDGDIGEEQNDLASTSFPIADGQSYTVEFMRFHVKRL